MRYFWRGIVTVVKLEPEPRIKAICPNREVRYKTAYRNEIKPEAKNGFGLDSIQSFLESWDFSGKNIVLFAASGGGGLGKTAREPAASCPGARKIGGRMLNGSVSPDALKRWAGEL